MTKPIFTAYLLVLAMNLNAQNPHGAAMKMSCAACHTSAGWEITAAYWQSFDPEKPNVSRMTGMDLGRDTLRFHHGKTRFELKGRHAQVDCRACHASLVFSEANSDCISCHQDMHQQTAGTDCARCHTTANWLVDNIPELHLENGFPLTGVHQSVSCEACHVSASNLQFNRIGNDCATCHLKDYNAATSPNHKASGFSTDCMECHDPFKPGWGTDKINHDFFPLTKGHEISDCSKCHVGGSFSNTPTNCFACHQQDFEATTNPNHVLGNFPNDCASCHTTDLDWMPAQYLQHDAEHFPIYSGKHKGQWIKCSDCHPNASNFTEFSCTNCHLNPETDNGHLGLSGYVYENTACLACHPTGDVNGAFNHDNTNFPLTGAHLSVACSECHTAGYAGTPTQCSACHTTDFNGATNPNHVTLGIPTDCGMCHTTAPGWAPATFPIHPQYHVLNGAHAVIANDCAACHHGDYNNTPNNCAGCHLPDYNATTNPNHVTAQFSTDCASCHSETAWIPATFNHNNTDFPLTGAHQTTACLECHPSGYSGTPTQCAACHTDDYNGATNPKHAAAGFPTSCEDCHSTTAWEPSSFNHDQDYFPIYSGKHKNEWDQCIDCHTIAGNFTSFSCTDCHEHNNPTKMANKHQGVSGYQYVSTACFACHPKGN